MGAMVQVTQGREMQLGKRRCYNFASLPLCSQPLTTPRETFPPMQMLNPFTKTVQFISNLAPGTLYSLDSKTYPDTSQTLFQLLQGHSYVSWLLVTAK